MLVPTWMGGMAAGNQQKHLSLSFATKGVNLSLEELKKVTVILYSNTRTVQIAEFSEISNLLNQHHSSLSRHVNAASRKNLQIQA